MDAAAIDPRTSLGAIRLIVADLDGMRSFYERVIGLRTLDSADGVVALGPAGGAPVVELAHRPGAPPASRPSTGLFHLALLVPDRAQLARALRRVADAGWRFTGASDHLVSEALYLQDPEGNGIELYRDRPRADWPYRDGRLAMDTLPLDLDAVLGELPAGPDAGMEPGTVLGHVHLHVADLADAERFYRGTLGFEVTVRGYPGALFFSAGGYHHHIGVNTWAGEGAPAPPPGARGLAHVEIVVPDQAALDAVAARVPAQGAADGPDGLALSDPSGNRLLVRAGDRR